MAGRLHGAGFGFLRRLVLLAAMLVALHPAAASVHAQTQPDLVALPGHTLPWLSTATPQSAAAAAAGQALTLTFVLKRSDEAGFQAFLNGVNDPASPQYLHFLSQQQLADRFGPTQAQFDHLEQYLAQQGFAFVSGADSRLTLTVRGTRVQAEQALNVGLHDYALGGRRFFANDRDPSLPRDVAAGVQSVAGLTNYALPRHSPGSRAAVTPATGSAPQPYAPASIATAYNASALGSGINGAGQKIGLLEFDNFSPSDVAGWLAFAGMPAGQLSQLSTVDVNGGTTPSQGDGTGEVLLDIDTVMGVARGANYVVYDTANGSTSFQAMLTAMINDHDSEISVSWFYCESQTTASDVNGIDSIVQGATASGISVFAATDDSGNVCDASGDIAVPADGSHVTAVGGTSLYVTSGNAYSHETYWNDGGSGGYGTSTFFTAPSYQAGLSGKTMRTIPDVSADGDPATGIEVCQATVVNVSGMAGGCPDGFTSGGAALWGGTSMATPIWAAGMALINQKLGHLTGNLNAALYPLHAGSGFHSAASMGSDFAHVGLGSFDLGRLYTALGGSSSYTLSINSSGCGSTSPAGAQMHSAGDAVSVSATPCDGSHTFSGWTVTGASCSAGAGTSPCSFTMPAQNVTLSAAFTVLVPAALSAPAPGSTLSAGSVTFSWTGVAGAQQYVLWAGTASGKYDLFWGSNGTGTSVTATGLPANGSTVYVQLWTLFASGWQSDGVHPYTAAAGPAALTTPVPGSTLGGTSATFSWSGVSGAQQYVLWIGTAAGKYDLFWGSNGTGTSVAATGLPANGGTVYAQLWTLFTSGWQSDGVHTYTASSALTTAVLSTPAPGSTLAGSTATFSWTGVSGADQYVIWIGTASGKYDLFWGSNGTGTSVTATGLPTNGSTLYVQLWTHRPSIWLSDGVHTYTAATQLPAILSTPAPGSALAGSSVTLSWTGTAGAQQYVVWIGSAPGSYNLFWGSNGTGTSVAATGLPTNGSTLYVQLWTLLPSGWQSDGVHTYVAAGH